MNETDFIGIRLSKQISGWVRVLCTRAEITQSSFYTAATLHFLEDLKYMPYSNNGEPEAVVKLLKNTITQMYEVKAPIIRYDEQAVKDLEKDEELQDILKKAHDLNPNGDQQYFPKA